MNLDIEPTAEQLKILVRMAKRAVNDEAAWHEAFGNAIGNSVSNTVVNKQKDAYKALSRRREELDYQDAMLLKDLGWPVYTKVITGSAPNQTSHYDIDDIVAKIFGAQVCTDSEHSGIFIFTTEEVAEAVLDMVRTVGGGGEVVLNNGDTFEASYSIDDEENPGIYGLGNWSAAREFLEGYARA